MKVDTLDSFFVWRQKQTAFQTRYDSAGKKKFRTTYYRNGVVRFYQKYQLGELDTTHKFNRKGIYKYSKVKWSPTN